MTEILNDIRKRLMAVLPEKSRVLTHRGEHLFLVRVPVGVNINDVIKLCENNGFTACCNDGALCVSPQNAHPMLIRLYKITPNDLGAKEMFSKQLHQMLARALFEGDTELLKILNRIDDLRKTLF